MVKNLLVLRNETSLQNTKDVFSYGNIDAYYEKISTSKSLNIDLSNIEADIVLITSQNSLDVVESNIEWFNFKKVYCLNSHIAKKVKAVKIKKLNWNNTKELAKYIIDNESADQKIVHLCADNANKLFYKPLEENGFKVNAINAYETSFVSDLPVDIISKLKNFEINNIMIFSKASLNALKEIFAKHNLKLEDYDFICFSKRIAEGLSQYYAKTSTLDEMLDIYLKKDKQ
tara:strand:+ start:697 stop:1386 length:690 start_codon:yes stop_codon:yes gene_type:complete